MMRDGIFNRPLTRALGISLIAHALLLCIGPGVPVMPGTPAVRAQLRLAQRAEPRPEIAPPVARAESDPRRKPLERSHSAAPAAAPGDVATSPSSGVDEPSPAQTLNAGIDSAGLRQYHVALGRTAVDFRNYPSRARAAGWEGRVPMRLTISATGVPTGLALIGSSGYALLDETALEMMRMAASRTEIPEALRGREFSIDLAVDYNRADEP